VATVRGGGLAGARVFARAREGGRECDQGMRRDCLGASLKVANAEGWLPRGEARVFARARGGVVDSLDPGHAWVCYSPLGRA